MFRRSTPLVALMVVVLVGCSTITSSAGSDPDAPIGTLPPAELGRVTGGSEPLAAIDVPDLSPGNSVLADFPDDVMVVGDSLTASAVEQIRTELEDLGLAVEIDGEPSRRMVINGSDITPGLDVIEEALWVDEYDEPELWIIELGTNDIGSDPQQFRAHVETILDEIPDDVPVLWLDYWIRSRPDDTLMANAVLRSALAGRDRTAVVDWYSNGDDAGVIVDDGVHLTEIGQQRFAEVMADGVTAMFGR